MLSALGLAGCSTPINVAPDTSLQSFKPITLSCQDTPETRSQIVAHNSVFDSLKTGKKVVYRDGCQKPEAKTS